MTEPSRIPVLTIAGSDPTGGAGLQGDLKTLCAHGVDGAAVVTAVTVQGRAGVARVDPVDPVTVAAQVRVVLDEIGPRAIKTGMLWSGSIVRAVADALGRRGSIPLVVDPVLAASAGGGLLAPDALPALREILLPLADLITPNLPEAAALLGVAAVAEADQEEAARSLLSLGPRSVLLKGGHGRGAAAIDVLALPGRIEPFSLPRLPDANAHGTGCALSASIAARLARGDPLPAAVRGAKAYVHRALAAAAREGPGAPLVHAVPP
jgi:hydroxymethylpyrimidine/phosphomethylpyrimidine kinase